MTDVFAIAHLLIDHAITHYGAEVDLIGYYGSHARGEARADSDLDIFYIPAEGKQPPIARTFLLDGLLFDFWAIPWATMAGFATGHSRGWAFAPALVQQTQVLYARSVAQAERFAQLQQQVFDLQQPAARPAMLKRALAAYPRVTVQVENMRLAAATGDLTAVRYAGWQVVQGVWECLALANQLFFARGLAKSLSEADKFEHRPADLAQLIATITTAPTASHVLQASETLAHATRQVLQGLQATVPVTTSIQEQFRQVYPEMRDLVGKLLAACAQGDQQTAAAHAWLLQTDVTMMLSQSTTDVVDSNFNLYNEFATHYRERGFPDLIQAAAGDLTALERQARRFDETLRQFLATQGVALCEFHTVAELTQFLAE
ncbi:MAG: nucleotidyltransferase domain-containing protein [Caldilineaceae bacterium]